MATGPTGPNYQYCCKETANPTNTWKDCNPCANERFLCENNTDQKSCGDKNAYCTWSNNHCYNKPGISYATDLSPCTATAQQCSVQSTTKNDLPVNIQQATESTAGGIATPLITCCGILLLVFVVYRYGKDKKDECARLFDLSKQNTDEGKHAKKLLDIGCEDWTLEKECGEGPPKYVVDPELKLGVEADAIKIRANVAKFEKELAEWKKKCPSGGIEKMKQKLEDKFALDYADNFEHALVVLKVGFIIILVISSIYYQIKYAGVKYAKTYFGGGSKFAWRPVVDALVTAILGGGAVSLVAFMRGAGIKKNINAIIIVSAILGIFVIAQEASGFNRYMAKGEILEKKGNYYAIDNIPGADEEIEKIEKGGDPFMNSFSSACAILFGIAFLYYVFGVMFPATFYGFKSGHNNIKDVNFCRGSFSLELFGMVILSALGPVFSPFIRGESPSSSSWIMVGVFAVVAFFLHFMFQYNGFYHFLSGTCPKV